MATAPRFAPGSLIEQETLVGETFERLAGVEFDRCRFERCRFADAALSRVVFERCVFIDCDLSRVALGDSGLRGVRFEECRLFAVDFSRAADNPEVEFVRSNLRSASFAGVNLRGTAFTACQLQESTFLETDLRDADFAGSELDGASFNRCALAGTDFSMTRGLHFEPTKNQAKDAFIAVETAIHLARAAGLRVAGSDEARPSSRPRASRRR